MVMYDVNSLHNLGLNIKLLRLQNKMDQQVLAKKLGISQTHMSNIEHGRVNVSLLLLLRIANIFNCTVDEILHNSCAGSSAVKNTDDTDSVEAVRLLLAMLHPDKKDLP